MNQLESDVCIVGAGFAGLAAAYKLKRAGRSVVVLEARDRVGGRVKTEILPDGTAINWGGTWIGEGHDRLYALAKEMGLETYPQYTTGHNLLLLNGKRIRYDGDIPRINVVELADLGLAIKMLNDMARDVPIEDPWNAVKAREYDSQTVGGWIRSRWDVTTDTAQKMLTDVFSEVFMSDPSEVSLLHALQVIHALTSIEWAIGAKGAAQQDLVVGGMQGLAERVAKTLGDAVHLQTPVRRIKQDARSKPDSQGVEVIAGEITVRAKRVINAAPPILAGRMEYDPPLPPLKTQLMDRSPAGQVIRCYAIYPEPFWRQDGLTGQGADIDGVPQASIDATPRAGKPGVLTAYIFGAPSRQYAIASAEERRQVFLDGLVKRFGPKAATPTFYDDRDWAAEEWTRGDQFAHYAPGVLTGFGRALREPCGRIHWAGTETATVWGGSIEGAIRSGERAADEVLEADEGSSTL
jgi:monoamine oxidase